MNQSLKQRLVGAAVLVSAAAIILPMLLRGPPAAEEDPPGAGGDGGRGFRSSVVPIKEPPPRPASSEKRERRAVAGRGLPGAGGPSRAGSGSARHEGSRPAATGRTGARARAGAGAKPRVGLSGWAIQLGSFASGKNAVALRDRLKASGYNAFTESAYGDKGAVTRVFVGPELERAQAEKLADRLRRVSKLNGLVVRYPSG